jgi:RimJ/RimL family protein N-acetyltransferase
MLARRRATSPPWLHSLNDQDRRAAIAVGIEDPALLGRGLGTEDVRLLLTHAFDELTTACPPAS